MVATDSRETAESRERVRILDLQVDRAGSDETQGLLEGFIQEGSAHHVVTANLQFLSTARRNFAFAEVVNSAALVVADGMPLVWMSKMQGAPIRSRITGHDLLTQGVALAAEKGYGVFLLGGAPGAAEEAAGMLRVMYPNLRVFGTGHGRVSDDGSDDRQQELTALIRDFGPQILYVGLGCPKQEFWINRRMDDLGVPVCVGVGGTFDILTGRLKRAPTWMQRLSLEWFYRLKQEPRRLWRRYVLEDLPTTLTAAGSVLVHAVFARVRLR